MCPAFAKVLGNVTGFCKLLLLLLVATNNVHIVISSGASRSDAFPGAAVYP